MDYTGGLVNSYIAAVGTTDAEALRQLNAALEKAITKGTFSSWKSNDYRTPPSKETSFMVWKTLPGLLEKEGLSRRKAMAITRKITLYDKPDNT